jgi:hypothetical protein
MEFTPLPHLEAVLKLRAKLLKLIRRKPRSRLIKMSLIALGMLAEKLAGKVSTLIFTDELLQVVTEALSNHDQPAEQLAALVAVEKFSITTETRFRLQTPEIVGILKGLEQSQSESAMAKQCAFYAQWILDHLFQTLGRKVWAVEDLDHVKCCYDRYSSTEGLKVSHDGLQLRNDSHTFQGFRATRGVTAGRWFYETHILTAGVMQIGWANSKCHLDPSEGQGVGDDNNSFAYDGNRRRLWKAEPVPFGACKWAAGDYVGFYVDIETREFWFTLNGADINGKYKYDSDTLFAADRGGLRPAASLTTFQHCAFNFGQSPYKYPPEEGFKSFNHDLSEKDVAELIRSKHLLVATTNSALQADVSLMDLSKCTICYATKANTQLKPCNHEGFCSECSVQFQICPICRAKIIERTASIFTT